MTSRPETPIRLGFKEMDGTIYNNIVLHNISKRIIENDILVFLTQEMTKIRENHSVIGNWPGQYIIEVIAKRASGLLIYATAVCRYIGDLANPEGPEERLKLVLYSNSSSQSFTKTLDEIYTRVLQNAVKRR